MAMLDAALNLTTLLRPSKLLQYVSLFPFNMLDFFSSAKALQEFPYYLPYPPFPSLGVGLEFNRITLKGDSELPWKFHESTPTIGRFGVM